MSRAVVNQQVLDFTVQIRATGSADPAGAGILVSPDGHVLTCEHVVAADQVDVVLPGGVRGGATVPAMVIGRNRAADLAVLLLAGPIPQSAVARLGRPRPEALRDFLALGFPNLGDQVGALAFGKILGPVPRAGPRFPPLQLASAEIAPGMSGAAVLDVASNLVVALVSAAWLPDEAGKHRDTAWATDIGNAAELLPAIPVRTEDLPRSALAGGAPAADEFTRHRVAGAVRDLAAAPPRRKALRGREALLAQLAADDADAEIAVTALIGFAGQGKSALARACVDGAAGSGDADRGVLWWSFDANPAADDFFGWAFGRLLDTGALPDRKLSTLLERADRGAVLAALLADGSHLLVLDGVEAVLTPAAAGGRLPPQLGALVRELATGRGRTRCLLTSRLPVLDLTDLASARCYPVGPLPAAAARKLLADRGVRGGSAELDRVADELDRHPLALALVGSLIAERHRGDAGAFTSLAALAGRDRRRGTDSALARLHRILDEYAGVLTAPQRCLLQVLGVQRMPLRRKVLARIGQGRSRPGDVLAPIRALDPAAYDRELAHLVSLGLVLADPDTDTLSCHAVITARFAESVGRLPADQRRRLYLTIAQAFARNLKPGSYAKLGAGAGVATLMVAARRFHPAPIVAAVNVARDDPLLREAVYFARKSRDTERKDGTR